MEFGALELHNTKNADVLVLAGDILLINDLFDKKERHFLNDREFIHNKNDLNHTFLQNVCEEFKNVIYIFGNHEYYKNDFATAFNYAKEKLFYLKNLHILEKEKLVIDDVIFLCGTMWTDFNKNDPVAMQIIEGRMNDFQLIRNSSKQLQNGYMVPRFSAKDAYKEHKDFLEFATKELANEDNKKVVMVTHHCPSSICVPEKYKGDTDMNLGYVSDLSDLILDNPKIKAWICGHSHLRLDAMIGPTNILMNCRGYDGYEEMADTFELKYFEV